MFDSNLKFQTLCVGLQTEQPNSFSPQELPWIFAVKFECFRSRITRVTVRHLHARAYQFEWLYLIPLEISKNNHIYVLKYEDIVGLGRPLIPVKINILCDVK